MSAIAGYVAVVTIVTALVVAAWSVISRLWGSLHAERAWVRAVSQSDYAVAKLVEDLRRDADLLASMGSKSFASTYLERSLVELVDEMVTRGSLTDDQRSYIFHGLRQPSEVGRRLYAHRLAEEAIAGRVAHDEERTAALV